VILSNPLAGVDLFAQVLFGFGIVAVLGIVWILVMAWWKERL
jgi:hypothetical protein